MTTTPNLADSAGPDMPAEMTGGLPHAHVAAQDATRLKLTHALPVPFLSWQRIVSSIIATLFHVAVLFLLVRTSGVMPDGDSLGWGPGVGGGGGGSSGEEIYVLELPAEAPAAPEAPVEEEVEPPVEEELVIPTEEVVVTPPPDTVPSAPAPVATTEPAPPGAGEGTGTGIGSGTGSGLGPGSGSGTGGGSGAGTGTGVGDGGGAGRIIGPSPIALILPPNDAPSEVRGRSVKLRLLVDANGTVRQVSFETRSGNRDFDARLERTAKGWKFRPARAGGRPVDGVFEVDFDF